MAPGPEPRAVLGAQKGLCSQGPSSLPMSASGPVDSNFIGFPFGPHRLSGQGFVLRAQCAALAVSLLCPCTCSGQEVEPVHTWAAGWLGQPLSGREGVPPPQALSPPPAGGAPLSDAAARAHPPGGGDPAAGPGGGHRRGPQPHRHHHQHPQRGGQRFPGRWASVFPGQGVC